MTKYNDLFVIFLIEVTLPFLLQRYSNVSHIGERRCCAIDTRRWRDVPSEYAKPQPLTMYSTGVTNFGSVERVLEHLESAHSSTPIVSPRSTPMQQRRSSSIEVITEIQRLVNASAADTLDEEPGSSPASSPSRDGLAVSVKAALRRGGGSGERDGPAPIRKNTGTKSIFRRGTTQRIKLKQVAAQDLRTRNRAKSVAFLAERQSNSAAGKQFGALLLQQHESRHGLLAGKDRRGACACTDRVYERALPLIERVHARIAKFQRLRHDPWLVSRGMVARDDREKRAQLWVAAHKTYLARTGMQAAADAAMLQATEEQNVLQRRLTSRSAVFGARAKSTARIHPAPDPNAPPADTDAAAVARMRSAHWFFGHASRGSNNGGVAAQGGGGGGAGAAALASSATGVEDDDYVDLSEHPQWDGKVTRSSLREGERKVKKERRRSSLSLFFAPAAPVGAVGESNDAADADDAAANISSEYPSAHSSRSPIRESIAAAAEGRRRSSIFGGRRLSVDIMQVRECAPGTIPLYTYPTPPSPPPPPLCSRAARNNTQQISKRERDRREGGRGDALTRLSKALDIANFGARMLQRYDNTKRDLADAIRAPKWRQKSRQAGEWALAMETARSKRANFATSLRRRLLRGRSEKIAFTEAATMTQSVWRGREARRKVQRRISSEIY